MKGNINDHVKVKLTEKGKEILADHYGGKIPKWFNANYVDLLDYYEFALWDLMCIFGRKCYMGAEQLFVNNEIIFL